MQLSENKRMALVNLERQAGWFIGFFRRSAQRIIEDAANENEDRR